MAFEYALTDAVILPSLIAYIEAGICWNWISNVSAWLLALAKCPMFLLPLYAFISFIQFLALF